MTFRQCGAARRRIAECHVMEEEMKFEVMNRWSGDVQFTAEIECAADAPPSLKIGLAVKWAVANKASLFGADISGANLFGADISGANLSGAHLSGANLSGASLFGADISGANLYRAHLSGADLSRADLCGANLYRADLSRADLYRANLSGANLSGANLSGADLSRADLSRADLYRANLSGANLSGADLSGADLYRANLSGANLSGADLSGADLCGADLCGANLSRAKWADGVTISKAPIQIGGFRYVVTILDEHMQIGCELHRLSDWETFDDRRIAAMDGASASRFWRDHKEGLLALARGAGRSFAEAGAPVPASSVEAA